MSDDIPETTDLSEKFDFSAFPPDTLIHERREVADRRAVPEAGADPVPSRDAAAKPAPVGKERRARKERRRRIDPTTFEKQYTEDELEFMNAMQKLKTQECKSFPSYGDVLRVARVLGYRKGGPATGSAEPDPGAAGPHAR